MTSDRQGTQNASTPVCAAFRKVALLVMLAGDVADVLYAQECIFARFCRHVKNLTAISLQHVPRCCPLSSDLSSAARYFSWPCCGFVVWLDRHEPLYMFSHKSRIRNIPGGFPGRSCVRPRCVVDRNPLPCGCDTPLWCRGQTPCAFPQELSLRFRFYKECLVLHHVEAGFHYYLALSRSRSASELFVLCHLMRT